MSNEELCVAIQQGAKELQPELWQSVQSWAQLRAYRFYSANKGNNIQCERDDLTQSAYLAMLDAIETFDATAGSNFLSWFTFYMQREFNRTAGFLLADDVRYSEAVRLDKPLSDGEEGDTLADITEQPEAQNAFEAVEDRLFNEGLRSKLEAALNEIPEQ